MKIITHCSLIGQIFPKTSFSFSNFLKNPTLTLDDLNARPQSPIPEAPAAPFNIPHPRSKGSSSSKKSPILNMRPNQQKTLNRMFESLNKSLIKKVTPTFRNKDINPDTQIQNAISFMKYLDHSLEKAAAVEIVVMVEKYCSMNNGTHKQLASWPTLLEHKLETGNDPSERLFKSIRDHLVHNLNYFSENMDVNDKLIDSLFEMLAEADPSYITIENFEHECFTLDEEERRHQVTGKQYFEASCGSKYFDEKDSKIFPTPEELERSKYKVALEEAFQLKDRTKFSKLHLKKDLEAGEEEKKEPKLNVASEKVVFRKKNVNKTMVSKQTQEEDRKCAYAYELPFNITKDEADKFIKHLESSKGIKIESYVLFPYKDFIEKNHHQIIYRVPDQFQQKDMHLEREMKPLEIDELTKPTAIDKKKRADKTKPKAKSKFDDVPLENEPSRIKCVTEALLLKIKKENYSKFNKSSMLIKFASKKDKQAILTQETRLYGLNYTGFRNVKFEQGYCKSTISLTGFSWGCGSKQLERHLNKVLEPEKIPIKVDENCILTKNSITIQFDYLSEAFLAIQRLNDTSFQNKQLKAHLTYGPVKLFNRQYNANAEDSYQKLKKKIQASGAYYQKKFDAELPKGK